MNDIRYALRTLRQRPALTAVILVTLAVGIGATTAMFGVLYAVLLRPLPFSRPQQLLLVRTYYQPEGGSGPLSPPDYRDLRDTTKSFQSAGAIRFAFERTVNTGGVPERVRETSISLNLLPELGVQPVLGRGFTRDEERGHVVLLSYEYWQRRFNGSADAIGKTLTINGENDVVVGVLPPRFVCVEPADLFRPMEADPIATAPRRNHNWTVIVRLRDGVSLQQARSELAVFSRRLAEQYPDSNRNTELRATPLQEAMVQDYRLPLLVLMAAVTLVLLIACGNVAGLLLARGAARRNELAVRVALGASPGRLVRQLLTETLLLTIGGGALGIALAIALQALSRRHPALANISGASATLDPGVLAFAVGASLVVALLCGLAPAWAASNTSPAGDLKSGARSTGARSGARLRSGLVIGQIALSVALLIGSGLLLKTLSRLRAVDLGFDPQRLLTAQIALPSADYSSLPRRTQFYRALQDDLRRRPGIEGAGLINLLPVRSPFNNVGVWPADAPPANHADAYIAYRRWVLPGYFEAMHIALKAGRTIADSDEAGRTQVIVLNEPLARRLFPDRDPLGRWVVVDTMSDQPYTAQVVGIVAEEKIDGANSDSGAMYMSYLQDPLLTMEIAVRGDPTQTSEALRSAVAALDRNVPVARLQTMQSIVDESLGNQRLSAQLLAGFALAAVLLAAIGLYGVLAFYVGQRTQEIGVRMALGAGRWRVLALVVRRGMLLVGVGLAVGLALSWWGARLLRSLLFGVGTNDAASFAAALLVLAGVGLLSCSLPAWRASKVDPMVALRNE